MEDSKLELQAYRGQSVNSLCRTCLNVLDLESEIFYVIQSLPYLFDLFNILQSDQATSIDLPPNICEFCYNKLQDIVGFQKQCNDSFLNFQILVENNILIPLVKLEETFNGDDDFSDGEDNDFIDPLQTLESDAVCVVNVPLKKPTKPRKPRAKKKATATAPTISEETPAKSEETSVNKEETPAAEVDIPVDSIIEEIKVEQNDFKGEMVETFSIKLEDKEKDASGASSADDNEYDDATYQSQDGEDDTESDCSDKDASEEKPKIKKEKKPKKPSKFKCEICPKTFYMEFRFKAHVREHMGLVPFECPHCDSGFSTYDSYKAHIKELHENLGVVYKCTEPGCTKTYTRHFSLQGHLRQKHAEKYGNKKPFMCEECGKTFVHKSALNLHLYSHNEKEKPFPCEQCQKRFTSRSALNQHMLRHTGEKNFMCPYCGLQKYNKTDLKLHINYHTKERQWPCKYPGCTYVGNRSSAIGRHVRGVHEQIKNYQCKFCDRKFNKKETMKHHEMTHTGEKPHVCDICGWRFIQAIALKKHRETHSRSRSQGV
ncbi:hypothetical protein ACFFRR_005039 [Megaselia abdita]